MGKQDKKSRGTDVWSESERMVEFLHGIQSKDPSEAFIYSNLAHEKEEIVRFYYPEVDEDLERINDSEYRKMFNAKLIDSKHDGKLDGISESKKNYGARVKFQYDLYFRHISEVGMSLWYVLKDVLINKEDEQPLVLGLHRCGSADTCSSDDGKQELQSLVLNQNDLVHLEITQSPCSIVKKLWQLQVALSLKNQMWEKSQPQANLVAMGVIVCSKDKEALVHYATAIAQRWKGAADSDMSLANCGIPVFLCFSEYRDYYSIAHDTKMQLVNQSYQLQVLAVT